MISKKFYKNRIFFSESGGEIKDKEDLFFQLSIMVLEKNSISGEINSVFLSYSGLDYDVLSIKMDNGNVYTLKISFDQDCLPLEIESNFIKKNSTRNKLIPIYIGSGIIKIGENIKYLLLIEDSCFGGENLDYKSIIENSRIIFGCLYLIVDNCESDITFVEYAKQIFENYSFDNFSEISSTQIFPIHSKEKLDKVIEVIKNDFNYYSKSEFFNEKTFCHGNINQSTITSNNALFKFLDFSSSFMGNKFLDPCFFSLNMSFDQTSFNKVMREFCSFHMIDYESSKENFRTCLDAATCLFLYKLLISFLIEQCIYKNSRQDNVMLLMKTFDCCRWYFKRLKSYHLISEYINEIYQSPSRYYHDID